MAVRLGITGGIGSGKSYVCQILEEHFHIPIYYCDDEAKRLNVEHPQIRQELTHLVGQGVYFPDGSLNKPFLAQYLFACPEHIQQINAIVHPRLKENFVQWAHRQTTKFVGIESAILFESGLNEYVDYSIMVAASLDIRLQRILQRDRCTKAQAMQRINSQMDEQEKLREADYIIHNDGKEPLIPQIEQLIKFF